VERLSLQIRLVGGRDRVDAMSRFYMTLPSNSSMQCYPDNTVARYTTKLANPIELEGDWEVGLAEISFPSAVENVLPGRCYYDLYFEGVFYLHVVLPAGNHRRVRSLLDTIRKEQHKVVGLATPILEFSYTDARISMTIGHGFVVKFSLDLAHMLGLDGNEKYSENVTATRAPSLGHGHIYSVYVYCDILEHSVVGDTTAPLLRIIDKPHTSYGNVHRILNPILHTPLQKKRFDSVEINLMTDDGMPVPFLSGKSLVVLEFRRVIHPLFGI